MTLLLNTARNPGERGDAREGSDEERREYRGSTARSIGERAGDGKEGMRQQGISQEDYRKHTGWKGVQKAGVQKAGVQKAGGVQKAKV